jgi:tetratricopeptide (TPR) repeat protein
MKQRLFKSHVLALLSILILVKAPMARAQSAPGVDGKQDVDGAAVSDKHLDKVELAKSKNLHLATANGAMQDAQTLRKQIDTASAAQRPELLSKMNADYTTAIAEYREALLDTTIGDENAIVALGLIGVVRNGLITQEKAVDMLVQDKNLPVVLSNLGAAYDGAGRFQDAITTLGQAAILKPEARTYMQLGTDLAQLGKTSEATATCEKILALDPTANNMQAGCYKNVAIVLMNTGKFESAVSPLQAATKLNPLDATSWKLLGDALVNKITTMQEHGKTCYVLAPGTLEAYQKYLELEPTGFYAAQVKEILNGLTAYAKCAQS